MDEILTGSLSSFSEFLSAKQHQVHIMPPLTQIVMISHFLFACIETKTNCGLCKKGCWGNMCGQVETSGRNVSVTGRQEPVGVLLEEACLFIDKENIQTGKKQSSRSTLPVPSLPVLSTRSL